MDKVTRRNRYLETGEVLVSKLKASEYSLILDLGCGENLYSDINGMIGIDIDSPHADIHADIANLPYKNCAIDCVLAFGSLVYGDRVERNHLNGIMLLDHQIKEINRVLKFGGSFYGRTRYLDIINIDTLVIYEQLYGFERKVAQYISHVSSKEKRVYWEWIKVR
jgi:SAM-dependent methyltransferase